MAARWLRGLLGCGKKPPPPDSAESSEAQLVREKKIWGFGKPLREKRRPPRQTKAAAEVFKGSYRTAPLPRPTTARAYGAGAAINVEEEQDKRAIAVAAATAAVAEAAVVAAQAAAAVVRLTSSGRGTGGFGGAVAAICSEYGKREERAAVRIQSVFRGCLARRALRALRGLVKLQALVRGNIVRKQAAETLRCMQSLVRVQARARACRAVQPEERMAGRGHHTHVRKSCKTLGADGTNSVKFVGQNWLEGWIEERYYDSRTSSKRSEIHTSGDNDKNVKILKVDSGKTQYMNSRRNNCSPCSMLTSDQSSCSFATMLDSPSKDSTVQQSVPSTSSVGTQQPISTPGFPFVAGDYEESPQLYCTSSQPRRSRKGPFTPTKSDCSRSLFSEFSDDPNYMSNTKSSSAKLRSQSAPKQRPDCENPQSIKRSVAHAYAQNPSRSMSSSLHAKIVNKAYLGSGRLDKLGKPVKC